MNNNNGARNSEMDSEKEHSKTWIAMQKYKGTVTVYDKSLFY